MGIGFPISRFVDKRVLIYRSTDRIIFLHEKLLRS